MVAKLVLVAHIVPFQQCFKFLLNKVGIIVTNEDTGDSETVEDNLFEEPSKHLEVIGGTSKGFHPVGHVIYRNQDILAPSRRWKWAHEIHTPNIKNFDLENVVKGHFISP